VNTGNDLHCLQYQMIAAELLRHTACRINESSFMSNFKLSRGTSVVGAWGSVVVKVLRYKSMGPGIDPRWCH
jgi:hypothetical protein